MSRALDDVIVLDLTRQFCSSLSGAFLADLGARVIRLDLLPLPAATARAESASEWNHEADLIHRNKQSFALDPARGRRAALSRSAVRGVQPPPEAVRTEELSWRQSAR